MTCLRCIIYVYHHSCHVAHATSPSLSRFTISRALRIFLTDQSLPSLVFRSDSISIASRPLYPVELPPALVALR